jgi:hypothetical protein
MSFFLDQLAARRLTARSIARTESFTSTSAR